MNCPARILLIEHVDAIGAAAADARMRVAAFRELRIPTDVVILDRRAGEDLLYESVERLPSPGAELLGCDEAGLERLARRARSGRAELIVWAGVVPGGGAAARTLPAGVEARWWPTGFAPGSLAAGPLEPLFELDSPVAGCVIEPERSVRARLSLWDGPYVLAPAAPTGAEARRLCEAFARGADEHDGAELVVLERPVPEFAALARAAGIEQRVHFVGPAPREAEAAWLAAAALALVPSGSSVSGGWLLRAMACGCPLLPLGGATDAPAAWLAGALGEWWDGGIAGALASALAGTTPVRRARERGREVAARHRLPALTARIGTRLLGAARRAAA